MPIPLGILAVAGAGAAGGGSYDLLETTVLGSDAASVTFSSVNTYTGYKHLQVRYVARTSRASTADLLKIRLNSDTGSNYASHYLKGDGSVTSGAYTSETDMRIGHLTANTSTANNFAAGIIEFLDAFNTNKNTTVRSLTGATNADEINLGSGLWNNTAAITTINFDNLSGDFKTGSRFSLYGIK